MDENKNKGFEDLTGFVRRSVKARYFILPIALIVYVDYLILRNLEYAIIAVVAIYLLAILFDMLFSRISKITFPLRRSVYLNFVSLVIWSVFFWILIGFNAFRDVEISMLVSISSTTMLRFLIFYVFYPNDSFKEVIPSMNYVYSALIFFLFIYTNDYRLVVPFIISSLIYAMAAYYLIRNSTKKFVKKYKTSPSKILEFFLNSNKRLETNPSIKRFFDHIYRVERSIPVKVIDIKATGGKRKVALVIPYIHPGPFGTLGSSNLPQRLQDRLADIGDLMVFHSTTSNDNNCRGDSDIDSIASAVRIAIDKAEYADTVSRPKKVISGKYVIFLQKFGDYGFGALVPEKTPFDDVSLDEGLKIISHMKKSGARDFAVIDAQNNFTKKAPELRNCSATIKSFEREFNNNESKYKAKIGYSKLIDDLPGLGPSGIQALVIQTAERFDAIVLTDSNNITTDLIEKVKEKVRGIVSGIEIYTTDNHYVNAGVLDVYPFGAAGDLNSIAESIANTVLKAKGDVESVMVGMSTEEATVKMGEKNNFQNLISSVFSSLRTAKFTAMYTLPASVAASLLVFRFI